MSDEQAAPSPENSCADRDPSRRILSREELYDLVWKTPLSRLSKQFGLSDVGLRKICERHKIPTPPVGWWAKRAHGKPVCKEPLPSSGDSSDYIPCIILREGPDVPAPVEAEHYAAVAQELACPPIAVPSERPAKLHPIALATSKALHAAKADNEGFKHASDDGAVDVTASSPCIDRVLRMIDAFVRALDERGYNAANGRGGVRVVVDGVPYEWRMYELKDQAPHEPTKNELKEQAFRDEMRAKYPDTYSSSSKAYRSFDSVPSGRLGMVFLDASLHSWRVDDRTIGRWRDSKNQRLEEKLTEALATLVSNAVTIKHRLAAEAEKERLRREELERQHREQARWERQQLRHDFLLKKADEYAKFEKLSHFAEYLKRHAYSWRGDQPIDWIISELEALVKLLGSQFERDTLNREIASARLYIDSHVTEKDVGGE
jgi:hypothetical protein